MTAGTATTGAKGEYTHTAHTPRPRSPLNTHTQPVTACAECTGGGAEPRPRAVRVCVSRVYGGADANTARACTPDILHHR
eukprot:4204919-Prymnesium_polylepis.1